MLMERSLMSWGRVGKSLQHAVAHGLLLLFSLLLVLKLDRVLDSSWWVVFSPLWLFHATVSRSRFSLPAPSMPHNRRWAPFHAVMATPFLAAFELLLCIHLQSSFELNLKIVFVPLLAFEISIFVDNIRMCRSLMPGDEENMSDEAIWETLPHFWIAISMVFFIAATAFTLLKLCGDVAALGWWDLFINFGIAQCFAFIVCTKWYNPSIHRRPYIRESGSSPMVNTYLDWRSGIVVSPEEDQEQNRMCCNLQEIGGHIMKVPIVCFQVLLIMHLEGTPSGASQLSYRVIFAPLFLLQGAGFLFATYGLIEKVIILANREAASGGYSLSSKIRELFGFFHHGSRLLGWWSIDEGSQEEQARLYHAVSSSYNTFSPDIVKKLPKADLVEEIWRLQEALNEQAEITKVSQQEYERLQNDKVLCRVCFEEHINVVLLPCRHHVICSTCGEKCKRCPICRSSIEVQMPVNEV
ncbi:unnamed protein product [Rhodiola kirilowii]